MLAELSRGAGDHKPIEEPVPRRPANEPPIIERPPQNEPNELAELPLQDPSPTSARFAELSEGQK